MNNLLFPPNSPESIAMWAIGLDSQHHPYHRHGKLYYKPCRNHYTPLDKGLVFEVLKNLKAKGLADSKRWDDDHETFWLTRAGLDWLGERLGITIHSMER